MCGKCCIEQLRFVIRTWVLLSHIERLHFILKLLRFVISCGFVTLSFSEVCTLSEESQNSVSVDDVDKLCSIASCLMANFEARYLLLFLLVVRFVLTRFLFFFGFETT